MNPLWRDIGIGCVVFALVMLAVAWRFSKARRRELRAVEDLLEKRGWRRCAFCRAAAAHSCDGCDRQVCPDHGKPLRFAVTRSPYERPFLQRACPACEAVARKIYILEGDNPKAKSAYASTPTDAPAESESVGLPKGRSNQEEERN